MINWEVILWTCITIAVLMGIIGMILSVISAVNMKKRRKEIGDIHTTLAVMKSLSMGITPDNPCPTGEVNRVVKGVILYPYTLN